METQRCVGDSILDVIGDLERTVISGIDGEYAREGNASIVKLKELVRVLCGELTIKEYLSNNSESPAIEDVPRRRTGSVIAADASSAGAPGLLDPVIASKNDETLPDTAEMDTTISRTRRHSSVNDLLAQPDSDDDASASPRPLSKKQM